jgi:hypothetical protein
VLLATTGTGLLGRYVLLPARRHGLRAYTSLFPYRTPAGPVLLAAIPTAGSPRQYELAYARPSGPWLPFGTLEVTQTTYRGHDLDLSFDPVLNVVPGLETYDWAARLRRFSYAASRRAREHRNGQPTSPQELVQVRCFTSTHPQQRGDAATGNLYRTPVDRRVDG